MMRASVAIIVVLGLAACSGPRPILYPNDHYRAVGEEQAARDMDECARQAEDAGARYWAGDGDNVVKGTAFGGAAGAAVGAVGGAIAGSAGRGAAYGAATGATLGFLRALIRGPRVDSTYAAFVERCLYERGYDPMGWH